MSKLSLYPLIIILAATITGCGGSSSNNATAISGFVSDPAYANVRVYCDINDNESYDTDEPSDFTDTEGNYAFTSAETTKCGSATLYADGDATSQHLSADGVVISGFTGRLSTSSQGGGITPFTTLVDKLIASGQTEAEAEATVKAALGLSDVTEPLSTIDPTTSPKLQKAASLVQQMILDISATVEGAKGGTTSPESASRVSTALADALKNGVKLISDTGVVDSVAIKNAVEKTIDKTIDDDPASANLDKSLIKTAMSTAITTNAEKVAGDASTTGIQTAQGVSTTLIGATAGALKNYFNGNELAGGNINVVAAVEAVRTSLNTVINSNTDTALDTTTGTATSTALASVVTSVKTADTTNTTLDNDLTNTVANFETQTTNSADTSSPPVASNIVTSVQTGLVVVIQLTATDADNDNLTFSIPGAFDVGGGALLFNLFENLNSNVVGSVVLSEGNSLRIDTSSSSNTTDSLTEFTYSVSDGTTVITRTVTVHLLVGNALPIGKNENFTITEGEVLTFTPFAYDRNGDAITVSFIGEAAAVATDGLVNLNTTPPSYKYDRALSTGGAIQKIFNYTVSDPTGTNGTVYSIAIDVINLPPTANAGADQEVEIGTTVTLDGSGADAVHAVQYSWSVAGDTVTFSDSNIAAPTFTAPSVTVNTDITLTLTVTDDEGFQTTDDVIVTVLSGNSPPFGGTASASSISIVSGGEVTLSASDWSDAEDDAAALSYNWSQVGGTNVTFTNGDKQVATFTAPTVTTETTYQFQLTVTDSAQATATYSIEITVTASSSTPAAECDISGVTDLTSFASTVTACNGFQAISVSDLYIGGDFSTERRLIGEFFDLYRTFDFIDSTNGTFIEYAEDVGGVTSSLGTGTFTWSITNGLLTINTNGLFDTNGASLKSGEQTTIAVIGFNSAGDQIGKTFEGGVAFDTENAFALMVDSGSSNNTPPTAIINAPNTVDSGSEVFLDGSSSTDAGGLSLSYSWSQTDTSGVTVMFTNPSLVVASFTAPTVIIDTTLTFELTVTNSAGATARDAVLVTVTAPTPVDSDGDGITDADEINTHGTNPNVADSDGDGLNDGAEINTHGTNPNVADSDGDGLNDGAEINTHGTNPNVADSDGDGLSDGAEVNTHGTNPNVADTDGDGLTDGAEVNTHGTNPNNADSDGDGLSDGDEVNIHGTNPLVTTPLTFVVVDTGPYITGDSVTLVVNFDVSGVGPFSYSWAQVDSSGITAVIANDNSITFPSVSVETTLIFELTVTDNNSGRTGIDTVSFIVQAPPNTPPVATDDVGSTDENTSFTTINVLANDEDTDAADTLFVLSNDAVTSFGGVVINNGNGTFTYEPNGQFGYLSANESTTDTFDYVVSDGNGGMDTGTVTITITGVNAAPIATADGYATDEDTSFTTGDVLSNDADADTSDVLMVDSINTLGTAGSVTNNSDGTFAYDPNGQFESLAAGASDTDTFTYTVSDGNGGTDTTTVTITINGVNEVIADCDTSTVITIADFITAVTTNCTTSSPFDAIVLTSTTYDTVLFPGAQFNFSSDGLTGLFDIAGVINTFTWSVSVETGILTINYDNGAVEHFAITSIDVATGILSVQVFDGVTPVYAEALILNVGGGGGGGGGGSGSACDVTATTSLAEFTTVVTDPLLCPDFTSFAGITLNGSVYTSIIDPLSQYDFTTATTGTYVNADPDFGFSLAFNWSVDVNGILAIDYTTHIEYYSVFEVGVGGELLLKGFSNGAPLFDDAWFGL